MTSRATTTLAVLAVVASAACGNYSNEDLEYMNAVPATDDIIAKIPRNLTPANEAKLSRDTHEVINTFNGFLELLKGADWIRTLQPTSRIPNGRIWGPFPMREHAGWEMQFRMQRDPNAPEYFTYWFEVRRIGTSSWIEFISGSFVATGGARQGMGTFRIMADGVRNANDANFRINPGDDGNLFKDLEIMYSTAAYPISVTMTLHLYPMGDVTREPFVILYHYEEQENRQAAMEFSGTDPATGAALGVESRWLATGRGRADATATDGATVSGTWTQCWNDSFVATYNYSPWAMDPMMENFGDILADCPDISAF